MRNLLLLPFLLLIFVSQGQSQKTTLGISLCNKPVIQEENSCSTITTTLDKLVECPEITYNKKANWEVTNFHLAKRTSDKGYVVIGKVDGNKIRKDILDGLKKEEKLERIEIQSYTVKDEKGNLKKLSGRKDAIIVFITE